MLYRPAAVWRSFWAVPKWLQACIIQRTYALLLCVGPPLFSTEPSSDQLTSTCCNMMIGGVNWLMILFEGGGWSITFMKTSWLHLVDRAKLDFFPPILTIKCKYKCQWYWFLSWSQRNVCIFSSCMVSSFICWTSLLFSWIPLLPCCKIELFSLKEKWTGL